MEARRQSAWRWLLQKSEDEAWEIVSHQASRNTGQGSEGKLDVFGEFSLGGGHNYSEQRGEADFRSDYRNMKAMNESAFSSSADSYSSSLALFQAQNRDPESIKAWRDCVTKSPKADIYAWGARDGAGNASVKVVYVAGDWAAVSPRVEIEFVQRENLRVITPTSTIYVATGSGQRFAVKTDIADRWTEVEINAKIRDSNGQALKSFSAEAVIPPKSLKPLKFPIVADTNGAKVSDASPASSFRSWNAQDRYIRHRSFLGYLEPISAGDKVARQDATFRVVQGLAGTCKSFESMNYPDHYLRHQGYRIKLAKRTEDQSFKNDATFCIVSGLANSEAISLESINFPSHYIRHFKFELLLGRTDGSQLFKEDSTFVLSPPLER